MIFLLTVPSVMVVAIILVHETARYFDKKISYISLTICAVLAFLVNTAAAAISPAPDSEYFLKLFAINLVAAAVVTALNKFLEVEK